MVRQGGRQALGVLGLTATLSLSTATAYLAASEALVSVARACGGVFWGKIDPEKRPSLSREKVLLIHDADRGQQHFIREVAFRKANIPFGFVVTTPTRPTVDKVDKQPFSKLRSAFPFAPPRKMHKGSGVGYGRGAGAAFGGGVTVLEKKKVGSFTAFVLAATDEQALTKWLDKNEFVTTRQTDVWLAHYVEMGFYYVAMRYDPPKKKAPAPVEDGDEMGSSKLPAVEAETIRISFATPIPYYPYFEPDRPKALAGADPRLMELWYVGTDPVVPVARRDLAGGREWVRPLHPGQSFPNAREKLGDAIAEELGALLPEGDLVLQTFQDQKYSRTGFQDILFASQNKRELTPEQAKALEPLLGILDPALVPEGGK